MHSDYCFRGTRDEECQPVLTARERDTKMTLSFLVKENGGLEQLPGEEGLGLQREQLSGV